MNRNTDHLQRILMHAIIVVRLREARLSSDQAMVHFDRTFRGLPTEPQTTRRWNRRPST